MNTPYRPKFGWLILGLAWGGLIGHAVVSFVYPSGNWPNQVRTTVLGVIVGAIVGIGGGGLADSLLRRSTNWMDWLGLIFFVLIYLLLLPAANVAVE